MFLKGIVESNIDPLKLGRIKVRVIGKHTDNKIDSSNVKNYLPVNDLPYASPVFPSGASSISGVCDFSVPAINSVVVCGYFDLDEQELFYIGTLAVLGTEKIEGFGISTDENPKKAYPLSDSVSSTTDQFPSTIVTNSLFNEPTAPHNTIYPKNNVIETKSGHLIELDDSDGTERIRIRHRSGTFNETHNNGDNVDKNIKDKYIIANNDVNVHSDNNTNVYVGNTLNIEVVSDTNINVAGNTKINVGGNTDLITTNTTTIKSPTINILGNVTNTGHAGGTGTEVKTTDTTQTGAFILIGDFSVQGNITATGDILATGVSDNHHTHP